MLKCLIHYVLSNGPNVLYVFWRFYNNVLSFINKQENCLKIVLKHSNSEFNLWFTFFHRDKADSQQMGKRKKKNFEFIFLLWRILDPYWFFIHPNIDLLVECEGVSLGYSEN